MPITWPLWPHPFGARWAHTLSSAPTESAHHNPTLSPLSPLQLPPHSQASLTPRHLCGPGRLPQPQALRPAACTRQVPKPVGAPRSAPGQDGQEFRGGPWPWREPRSVLQRRRPGRGGSAQAAPRDPALAAAKGGGKKASALPWTHWGVRGAISECGAPGSGEHHGSPQRGLHLSLEMRATPTWDGDSIAGGQPALGPWGAGREGRAPARAARGLASPQITPPHTLYPRNRWCSYGSGPRSLYYSCTGSQCPAPSPQGPPGASVAMAPGELRLGSSWATAGGLGAQTVVSSLLQSKHHRQWPSLVAQQQTGAQGGLGPAPPPLTQG